MTQQDPKLTLRDLPPIEPSPDPNRDLGPNLDPDLEMTINLSAGMFDPSNATPAELGVRIRPLVWADVTRVAALEHQLFGASAWTMGMLTEELRGAGRWYVGAQPLDDGGHTPLVGYGGIWFDGDHVHIMTIGVEPAHQRTGIGQCLMATLVDRARELGAASVLLEVAVNNLAAIAMYERAGFVQIGLRKRYYQPEDVDAYTMQFLLVPDPVPPVDAAAAERPALATAGHAIAGTIDLPASIEPAPPVELETSIDAAEPIGPATSAGFVAGPTPDMTLES